MQLKSISCRPGDGTLIEVFNKRFTKEKKYCVKLYIVKCKKGVAVHRHGSKEEHYVYFLIN